MPSDLHDFMSVKAFCKHYSDLVTENTIRWQLFNRETNGLAEAGAIFKRGGRWFICVPQYRNWIIGNG